MKNSALTRGFSRAPCSAQNTRACGSTKSGGPPSGAVNAIVAPSAVTEAYSYSSSGSQLSRRRTCTDPSASTRKGVPRRISGIRLIHNMISPGISSRNSA